MKRNTGISVAILSAILISSCSSERIPYARQEVPDCKTPNTRYIKSKAKPLRALKSVNRKYTRYASRKGWNRAQQSSFPQRILSIGNFPDKTSSGRGKVRNSLLTVSKLNYDVITVPEVLYLYQINLYFPEFKYPPFRPGSNNDKGEILYGYPDKRPLSEARPEALMVVNSQKSILMHDIKEEPTAPVSIPLQTRDSQEKPFQCTEAFLMLVALLAGFTTFAAIKASPKIATNISFWSAMNPWKTRIIFTGVNIGLGFGGVFLGKDLAESGIHFSKISGDLLLAAFVASGLLYPLRHSSIRLLKHSYLKQKALDLALAISGFMLMVHAGSDPEMFSTLTRSVGLKNLAQTSFNAPVENVAAGSQLLYYQDARQIQDEQVAPQKKGLSKSAKIMLTILSVIGALGLGFLLAAAACGIYCNGLEALAYITGIGGGVLIIVLAIWVIKSIWHPKSKKKMHPAEVTGEFSSHTIIKT